MARIDEVRERYEKITERLYTDRKAFAEYLKYAGKFYKLPTAQTMVMFETNPKATMVADYDTWKKFGHQVQRGANSIAVLNGGELKHLFDISQTAGEKVPYQWTLDKQTAQEFVAAYSKAENKEYKTLSSCVNAIGEAAARDNLANAEKALNISEENKAAFEKSFISITQYFIAARCELGSSFKYKNTALDLTAFDIVRSKAEAEKLTEYIQIAARPALLSMEQSINTIIAERSIDNGRNQTGMVRGGQDVLSRNENGERQNLQAGRGNIRVSGTGGAGTDGRGTEADGTADRPLGTGVAEVYDGELPRRNTVAAGTSELGADTEADRQRGLGDVGTSAETVRREQSPSENFRGDTDLGENESLDSGTRGNGTGSAGTQNINDTTAEEKSSAVSVSDRDIICSWAANQLAENEKVKSSFREHLEIQQEDEPVYDSITTYEWFKEDVSAAALALFSDVQRGDVSVPNVPQETVTAFVQNYLDDGEERYDINDTLTALIDSSLTKIEEVRSYAKENGIPYSDKSYDGEDIDPYTYDGSMSVEDAVKVADAHNLYNYFISNFSEDLSKVAFSTTQEQFKEHFDKQAYFTLEDYDESNPDEHWHKNMLNSPNYLTSVCDLVGASIYNELRLNAQYPLVVVKGSYNTDFSVEDVGLELNKVYSVEEFNAALTKANIMWNSDERFIDKLDSVNISVYASSDERISYNVELYASYRSIGDIIDTKPNNGDVSVYSKINNAVAEIESRTLTDNSERILDFFSTQHTQAETTDFVKSVYGDWITDTMAEYVATEARSKLRQNGVQIAENKSEETRTNSTQYSKDRQYIAERVSAYMNGETDDTLNNSVYDKAYIYAYENKVQIADIPEQELNGIIAEVTGKAPEIDTLNIPDDLDKFYVSPEMEQVTWIHYNPDSSSGGQFVYTYMSYDDIFDAIEKDEPLDYLLETCEQELMDRGTEGFEGVAEEFMSHSEDISSEEEYFVDKLFALTEPRYAIYQLKDDESLLDYHFTNFEFLKKRGLYIDRENYNRVYRGRLQEGETLEDIYRRFNINHPKDFRGHSLSVGDIVAVKQDGKITAHFVDSVGFKEVPDFTLSREERKARRTLTDNLPVIAAKGLSSDELDELSDKLFDYDNTPKYNGSTGYWKIGSGLSASEFEDITARYNRGENISAELAQKIIGIPSEISIYDFNSRGQYENTRFFVNRADDGLTFRTAEGFEITYSWEALGAALIEAAHKEFERHNELDRQVFEENTDRVITAVRNGETAGITLKKEKDEIVSDGHKPQFSNVKLLRNEENGFYITADTPQLEGGIIAVFGDDEKAVKDYVLDKGTDIYLAKNIKTVAEEKEETPVELPTQEVYLHDFSVGTPNTDNARQLSLFDEDVSFVMADSNAPAISQDMIDCVLRCGGNEPHSLERIVSQYQKNKGADSNTEFLRNEYGRDCFGIEYTAPDGQKRGRLAVTFDNGGIKIGIGDKADNPIANTVVTWEQAAQRIEELLTEGKYTSQLTIDDAEAVTRKALADKLWYLHQDVQVEYFIPNDYFKGGFPDSTERISEALKDEKTVSEYIEGMQDFIKQYEAYRNVLRFKFHKLPEMLTELQDLQLERRTFKTDKDFEYTPSFFISEDVKEKAILGGSGVQHGKFRVADFFSKPHTQKDAIDFLKNEYGTGGSYRSGFDVSYDAKGLSVAITPFTKQSAQVDMKWSEVAARISRLVSQNRYITERDIMQRERENRLAVENHTPTEGVPQYEVGTHIEIDYGGKHYSGEISYIGDIDVTVFPDGGYAWEAQVMNKEIFEENLRKDRRNSHLFLQEEQPIEIAETEQEMPEEQEKHDFTITDVHLGEGGPKAKFAANVAAIKLLHELEFDDRLATPEEQEVLSRYVGWGGLAQAFDENNSSWANEFKELYTLLSPEEYTAAKSTVLNAHYTSPTVINAIYKGLENLGFTGGNILEPAMGVGNFFGVMPDKMREESHLHGVEIDSITGRIAKQLYQTADIQIKGYEDTTYSDNFFDAAIGNVPFGNYSVSDRRYNRENFYIHDYFFAKTLDKVAPGGIVAFVTTKGTLDKQNPKVREYLAKRADLIGAIRLPNNAFKANAGTEVTTDIIFLQKREKMAVEMPDWCYIGTNSDGVPVNNYFLEHPEMILGTMKQGVEFSLYGNAQETACVPVEGAVLSEQLEKAVTNLKLVNAIQKKTEKAEKEAGTIPATEDVRNFTFAEVDGKMYFRENNIMTEVTETGKRAERLKGLNELRATFRQMLSAQENNCSDEELKVLQDRLNEQYDSFVKKHGYINDSSNAQVFSRDDDYNSLCALEVIDEENKTIEKSDFFSKRTVKYTAEITRVDTPQEAMQVSIDTKGTMDIPYMAQLCDLEPQQVIDILKADNLIYLNPVNATDNPLDGWEESSEYLSGNVRAKLKVAEAYAEDNPEFQRNAEALTSVLPPKLEAGDISARIGVSWVDVEDYQQFLTEYAKATFYSPLRRTVTGEYKIENKTWNTGAAATQIYGTGRMNAATIFENLLNNRDIVIRDKKTDADGREYYELNKKETDLAQDKALKMKEAFKRWLWETPERREKYVERYNNLFNCIVGRKFDGSRQTFPGMSPSIKLKPHQLDAVMRAKFGGNTLLAHCVGAGKSFEMVAATMEKKRLGLINKACVVVPKHLVGQMANEWLRLYPQAKILTASEKDFDKNHRQKFIGRCCTGDYDAVIMSYEQFEKIPMSMEYRKNFIQREIDTLQSGIDELSGDYRSRANNRSSIKDLERAKKRLETRLNKLIEGGGKTKDTSLTFEQLGFDSLVVDEAHNYKNGLVVSKMNRVSGVQTTPAQKSEDILMKTQYLNENYGEKNILFATGTPVSNSMTELYIMQRYLRPSLLENAGLQTFDDWASNFGEVVSKAELKPAGNGYRTKKRFAKFNNVPELMQMYKEFADIRTADMLDLPVPEIEGGKPQTIVAKPNEVQQAYMQVLAERSEAIHSGAVDPTVDNMLKITLEARLLGLDARCVVPNAENYADSKVNLCVDKVMEIYERTSDTKGVQAVFCDIAVHSDDGKFSVYDYIKAELVKRGIPESEICTAGDAATQKQRNEMYAQLRSGTKRIVIASTSKMGTGANIQTKLAALHNLDIPWKPSDIEQRNGRIIRQGNENPVIGVYNYVTENTFDAYLMNIIVTKQRFISQLMSGKAAARSCEDVDEAVLNYSEMQALASGDDRIKEKIELDSDVARLRLLESEHYNSQYRLDDTIRSTEQYIKRYTAEIGAAKGDVEFAAANKLGEDEFRIEIGGTVFTERKTAGEVLQKAAIKAMATADGKDHIPIGKFCGFELAIEKIHNGFMVATGLSLRHNLTYATEMDISGDIGNITRLENLFNKGIEKKLTETESLLASKQTDLQEAMAAKGKPFEYAEELAAKSSRLEQLNRELEVGKADEVIMGVEEQETGEHDKTEEIGKQTNKHKR